MNEYEVRQRLQVLEQMLKNAQAQLLTYQNNPQAYAAVQQDIRNIQTERSNLINALNGLAVQPQAQPLMQQQAPQPTLYYDRQTTQQPLQQLQQPMQQLINNVDDSNAVASTSKYNNRPLKEPVSRISPNVLTEQQPTVKKVLKPVTGSEFKPLELPGLEYKEVPVNDTEYVNEIKVGVLLNDIDYNDNIPTIINNTKIIVDSVNGGDNLKNFLIFTALEQNVSAVASDGRLRTKYIVDKNDANVILDSLKTSKTLSDLFDLLICLKLEDVSRKALKMVDEQITKSINHVLNKIVRGGFELESFMSDWRDVKGYLDKMDKTKSFAIKMILESATENICAITEDSNASNKYSGDKFISEYYDTIITGIYITSPMLNKTLDKLKYNEVKSISTDVSQMLYNLLDDVRKSNLNFSKSKICYLFTESGTYIVSYNILTNYYTVVKKQC